MLNVNDVHDENDNDVHDDDDDSDKKLHANDNVLIY